MPFFSILIPFRDRDVRILHKCLEAINRQSFQDFELLLLDYGSQEAVSQEVSEICKQYSFIQYFFSNTRGKLWNKCEAFNYLIQASKGEYLVMLDADIFVPNPFLKLAYEELLKLSLPAVLELRCFETLPNGLRLKQRTTRGMYIVARAHLVAMGGYDTFFRVWGVEDEEIISRITPAGKENPVFSPDSEPLMHIWHTHDYSRMPTGWLNFLTYQYLPKKQKNNFLPKQDFFSPPPKLLTAQDRPVLAQMNTKENTINFQFQNPLKYYEMQFMQAFSTLEVGKFLCVEQHFQYYIDEKKTIAKRLAIFLNKILSKLPFSYRLTDIATHDKGYITLLEVRDFLFYFLLTFENQILDYFFEYDKEKIIFWVGKKSETKNS